MVALFFVIKLKLQGVEALLLAQISVSSKKKKKKPTDNFDLKVLHPN